ncbi:MAG TPA: rhomboid family intramembrane serine protease [Terriglobia bacterium]|nr:rhomboid family intramembrane serine protease [Terriglobia bacterium]
MSLPPKLWFQWQRLKKAFSSSWGPQDSAPSSTVRMCPHCRALIDRNAKVCPLCGETTGPVRARGSSSTSGRIMGVIPIPTTASSAIVVANLALYAISWYMTLHSEATQLYGAPPMGGIDGNVLLRLGAKAPYILAGQWWRLVTAMFLHAGLLHIGMNMWCLVDLGPQVESLFSTTKFTVFYLVTGVAGFVLSLWWRPFGTSVGASGAIMGLIGILIGASFHHGHLGKQYRSQLWKWVIYIAIFGIFFNVDNAAHFGGLATGLVLGYLVPEGEPTTRPSENLWNTLAALSVLVIAASFVLMTLQLGGHSR